MMSHMTDSSINTSEGEITDRVLHGAKFNLVTASNDQGTERTSPKEVVFNQIYHAPQVAFKSKPSVSLAN